MKNKMIIVILLIVIMISFTGCSFSKTKTSTVVSENGLLNSSDIFTDKDLEQSIDTTNATKYTVSDGENINITKEGVYVISGSAENVSITIDVDDTSKVWLVLSDLTIKNESTPCIYIKNADKVFANLVGTNNLSVSDEFTTDDDTNTDAVIFSKDDLTINGTGTLQISSTNNGITSKDDLKITGGEINITCSEDAIEANNSIAIDDGNITINSKKMDCTLNTQRIIM